MPSVPAFQRDGRDYLVGRRIDAQDLRLTRISADERPDAAGRSRGRRGKDPKDAEIERLRRDNARLCRRLEQAETVIEIQKKLSRALGIDSETTGEDETP